jgi:hypothetical protein
VESMVAEASLSRTPDVASESVPPHPSTTICELNAKQNHLLT